MSKTEKRWATELAKKFGANVRRARTGDGMTQEQLGKRTGLSPNYVGFVERGERNITLKNIVKISRGFSTPLYALMKGLR